MPDDEPVSLYTNNLGLEIQAGAPEYSITLGYQGRTILAQIPSGQSTMMELNYNPDNPGGTRLIICHTGEKQC